MRNQTKRLLSFTVLFAVMSLYQNCGGPSHITNLGEANSSNSSNNSGPSGVPAQTVPFSKFSQVMQKNCVSCHGASTSPFSAIKSFANLNDTNAWLAQGLVVKGKPEDSPVFFRLALGNGKGPKNMPFAFGSIQNTMTVDEVNTVRDFILGLASSGVTAPPVVNTGTKLTCDPVARGTGQDRLNRLSKYQVINSLRQIFGDEVVNNASVQNALLVLKDDATLGRDFRNEIDSVTPMLSLGNAIADVVFAKPALIEKILPGCNPSSNVATCKTQLTNTFAEIAYRRPLTTEQKFALTTLVDSFDAVTGLKAGVAFVIASPYFHQHVELGEEVAGQNPAPAPVSETNCAGQVGTMLSSDQRVLFDGPNGMRRAVTGPINQTGWYVFEFAANNLTKVTNKLTVDVTVVGNAQVADLHVNGQSIARNIALNSTVTKIVYEFSPVAVGQPLRIGLNVNNFTAGSSATFRSIMVENVGTTPCGQLANNTPPPTNSDDSVRFKLSQHEIAARIAFRATGFPPDEQLRQAAKAGQLATLEQIRTQADRLLNSALGRRHVQTVIAGWLGVTVASEPATVLAAKAQINPTAFAKASKEEFDRFVQYVVFDKKGTFRDLQADNSIFAHTSDLASYFKVTQSNNPQKTNAGYAGLLLRPATLVSGRLSTDPITRGTYVRTRLLCDTLGTPDAAAVAEQVAAVANMSPTQYTTREIFTAKTSPNACMGCHTQINPLGFALEQFDSFGRPRIKQIVYDENGGEMASLNLNVEIDDLRLDSNLTRPSKGFSDFVEALATSPKAMSCMSIRMIEFARQSPKVDGDNCLVNDMQASLASNEPVYNMFLKNLASEDILYKATPKN